MPARIKKAVLYTSLAVNVVFVCRYAYHQATMRAFAATNNAMMTYSVDRHKYNAARMEMHDYFSGDTSDIIFFGNSLTDNFPLQELFNNLHIKNRGIGGNTTNDLVSRTERVVAHHPHKVFLMAGINDITGNIPEAVTRKNIAIIVSTIRHTSPRTIIYLQSILPVSDTGVTAVIARYNKWLVGYATEQHLRFINIFPLLLNGNKLDDSLTFDGVHLRVQAYARWKRAVERYVRE